MILHRPIVAENNFRTNNELLIFAIDSLISSIDLDALEVVKLSITTEPEFLSDIILSRFAEYAQGISIDEYSPVSLQIKVDNLLFSYPKAYRERWFKQRKIARLLEFDSTVELIDENIQQFERRFTFSDSFPANQLDIVQEDSYLQAEIDDYAFSYILWEPVLISVGSILITILFFTGR